MSGWEKARASISQRASATVFLPPSGFADDYDMRPEAPVEIGIKRVSIDVLDTARSWAAKKAARRHPKMTSADEIWRDAFNEALMQWVIARATCLPDDVNAPYWPCAEDVVPVALSQPGLLRLWEEHELLCVGQGVLSSELSLDECEALAGKLATSELFVGMKSNEARYCRRLLARVAEVAGIAATNQTTS